MAARKTSAVAYRFQRLHSALQSGHGLTVKHKREEPVPVFFHQGLLDGACGLHVVCMIVAIFGLSKTSALIDMHRRKYGAAARIWDAYRQFYFSGLHPHEMVEQFKTLELPVTVALREGRGSDVDGFVVQCLMQGDLVAIVTASPRDRRQHWSLAVGIEGNVVGQRHEPDTILTVDPSGSEPIFSVWNARLRKIGARTWLHEGPEWTPEHVSLRAAVRFRLGA